MKNKINKLLTEKKNFNEKAILELGCGNHKKVKTIGCKTIREKNGIAYSSRNFLLSIKEKAIASKIYKLNWY